MDIKPKQNIAQNKLLLLYLLKQSSVALSELQMVRIMGELDLIRYFDLKESLFELEQNGEVVPRATTQAVVYGVTEKGARMLSVLMGDMRTSYRDAIDDYLRTNRAALEKESQFIGEYMRLGENEYRVVLKVLEENRTTFEIDLIVYSKEDAKKMVERWGENAVSIYKSVLSQLI